MLPGLMGFPLNLLHPRNLGPSDCLKEFDNEATATDDVNEGLQMIIVWSRHFALELKSKSLRSSFPS